MHTAKTMNVAVIYDGAALDFSEVYKKYFSRVKQAPEQQIDEPNSFFVNFRLEDNSKTQLLFVFLTLWIRPVYFIIPLNILFKSIN